MKNLCVFGCLLNDTGKQIKREMLNWLEPEYDVLCIDQEPPGKLFEYPAIKYAINLAIDTNQAVLYLHTKGAAHPFSYGQNIIRNNWKHEFTVRKSEYFKYTGDKLPHVTTLYTGTNKETWFNAFVINPAAAKELLKTFHWDSNRFYFERMFCKTNIPVHGLIRNDMNNERAMCNFCESKSFKL